MKEEIAMGIKNAIEGGSSLESAAQSFVNAGYDSNDVKGAIDIVRSGMLWSSYGDLTKGGFAKRENIDSKSFFDKTPNKNSAITPPINPHSSNDSTANQKKSKSIGVYIAIVIVILIVLVGALGYLVYLLLK